MDRGEGAEHVLSDRDQDRSSQSSSIPGFDDSTIQDHSMHSPTRPRDTHPSWSDSTDVKPDRTAEAVDGEGYNDCLGREWPVQTCTRDRRRLPQGLPGSSGEAPAAVRGGPLYHWSERAARQAPSPADVDTSSTRDVGKEQEKVLSSVLSNKHEERCHYPAPAAGDTLRKDPDRFLSEPSPSLLSCPPAPSSERKASTIMWHRGSAEEVRTDHEKDGDGYPLKTETSRVKAEQELPAVREVRPTWRSLVDLADESIEDICD